jgi:hypothetical protein
MLKSAPRSYWDLDALLTSSSIADQGRKAVLETAFTDAQYRLEPLTVTILVGGNVSALRFSYPNKSDLILTAKAETWHQFSPAVPHLHPGFTYCLLCAYEPGRKVKNLYPLLALCETSKDTRALSAVMAEACMVTKEHFLSACDELNQDWIARQ